MHSDRIRRESLLDKIASAEEAARFIKNGMRWVAILRGRVHADAGADVTMLCSVLWRRGIDHIRVIENEVKEWLQVNECDSLEQLKRKHESKKLSGSRGFRAGAVHPWHFDLLTHDEGRLAKLIYA
jgi:hypothetical protein